MTTRQTKAQKAQEAARENGFMVPTPKPAASGPKSEAAPFAQKTPAQQRAIVHNAAQGDLNQCTVLERFWRERDQPAMADAYRAVRQLADALLQATEPPAQSSDPLPLMLQCVHNHAQRHAWVNTQSLSDETLTTVIAGAKTVAGAIAKAAISEKTPR